MSLDYPPSLTLLRPDFDSPLLGLIIDLEKLRDRRLAMSTPFYLFIQLKEIFHLLESLGSARIEGNHTTILDLVETQIASTPPTQSESMREILNMDKALTLIEQTVPSNDITRPLIRELHKIVVDGLTTEGDPTPGQYRSVPVKIGQAEHIPPEFLRVNELMDDLLSFIQQDDGKQYHLMKVALAHHAYTWIHPFRNGNGRTVRLLTYSMLIKQRFNVQSHDRILNPTAVFCNDRDKYYSMLAQADTGTKEGLENWCIYVLEGLKREIEKVDRLANFKWLRDHIWGPAINYSEQRQFLTKQECEGLRATFDLRRPFKASDLMPVIPGDTPSIRAARSRLIKSLLDQGLIKVAPNSERAYVVNIGRGSILLRGITEALRNEGFIPQSLFQPN